MWLRSLVALVRATSWLRPAPRRPRRAPAVRCRPHLEVLETRQLLSTYTVVLATDTSGTVAGVKVTATSGNLRYCIAQADTAHIVKHIAKTDTITFSPKLFAKPQTITLNPALGPLTLNDGNPLTLNGPAGGTVTVSGGDQVGVFDITSGTVVTISNLAITHGNSFLGGGIANGGTVTLTKCILSNNAAIGGGGILNEGTATLTNCTLINNAAKSGGGIYNSSGGTATLTNCTLSNNAANSGNGGGIYNGGAVTLTNCTLSNNAAAFGGGIYNVGGATATLTNCTLSNNAASYNDSVSYGGGIYNAGGATVTLTNCTLSNNSAGNFGGGIYNFGTATLTNCTLSHNSANSGGGIFTNGTLNLTNTLVAENSASTGPDIDGAVLTANHDLIGDGSGSTGISNGAGGNLVGGNGNPVLDPRLGPLQNNGGPTQTEALLPGSPAIGQADNAFAPLRDQRGVVRLRVVGRRVLGGPTDIGAYET